MNQQSGSVISYDDSSKTTRNRNTLRVFENNIRTE
jgi:hypothetical protein